MNQKDPVGDFLASSKETQATENATSLCANIPGSSYTKITESNAKKPVSSTTSKIVDSPAKIFEGKVDSWAYYLEIISGAITVIFILKFFIGLWNNIVHYAALFSA